MQVVVGILICILVLTGLYFAVKSVIGFDIIGPGEDSLNPNIRKKTIDIGRDTGLKSYVPPSRSPGVLYPTSPSQAQPPSSQPSTTSLLQRPYPYSPYYGMVRINSVYLPSYPLTVGGNFSLSGGSAQGINITGWQLKGNRANVVISQAVSDLNISGSLTPSDVILSSNSNVYVYDSQSPLKASFRLNKCTGYLNNSYAFSPSLPEYCPAVYKNISEIATFTGECQTYIRSLGTCNDVKVEYKNRFAYDAQCRAFLDKVGFQQCYAQHRYDPDFFQNEWRLWLRQEFGFDRQHDQIHLLDANGLIVAEYVY